MPPLDLILEQRILGRIAPEDFVGRERALAQIVRLAQPGAPARGLFMLAAPASGASELMRQAYDQVLRERADIVPFYFAFSRTDASALNVAQGFLQSFLSQLIAFRRSDFSLVKASLEISDLVEMAAPADAEWIERFIAAYERERAGGNAAALIKLCLSAPQRAAAHGLSPFVLIDNLHLAGTFSDNAMLSAEIAQSLTGSGLPFVLSGLRRKLFDVVSGTNVNVDNVSTLHLPQLNETEARTLIDVFARRNQIIINDQTRDLIAQQFECNPFYITALLRAARENNVALTSFLSCQQLYVDELLGGRLNLYFASVLESVAVQPATRRALVRTLYEATASEGVNLRSPFETWHKRLGLETSELQNILKELHAHELINLEANFIEGSKGSLVWMDYLQARYRLEVAAESRVLVVAETLRRSLKRAPETMARHYRREASLDLLQLLARFDCQRVPASLFHYDKFASMYRGAEMEEINTGLDQETELIRLPQTVHAAGCAAFHIPAGAGWNGMRCVVAHCFDAGAYTNASEVVWLVAEVESKIEAGRSLAQMACDRLTAFARACGFGRVRLWLIASEGFSTEACELLKEREAFGSSLQQIEFLQARIDNEGAILKSQQEPPDEFEMVIPMGDDTELIAAHTLEQIARRINFPPEAINQIKTALVEACINAAEHSLSPDRKIYQQFRVESDRLVVTVSSRGVVVAPAGTQEERVSQQNAHNNNNGHAQNQASERRGWGLKLIRSLMDEVEFERVDDGSRLRMTKYLHR